MAGAEATLTVIKGNDKGASWHLTPDTQYTIGRSRKNTIRLSDKTVSSKHAELVNSSGIWFVRDLDSKHGILVNGDQAQGKRGVFAGDVIRLGQTKLEFQEHEPPANGA